MKTLFSLKNKITLSGDCYKSDFYNYSDSSLAAINNNNATIERNIPAENTQISRKASYVLLQLNVTHNVAAKIQMVKIMQFD